MTVYLYNSAAKWLPRRKMLRLANTVCRSEVSDEKGQINLVVISAAAMKKLNRRFRGKDKPTDVLSFNLDHPSRQTHVFGEVYICDAIVRQQARMYDVSFTEEYLRLTCHGLLHLFGYDHIRPKDRRTMEEKERKFLSMHSVAAR